MDAANSSQTVGSRIAGLFLCAVAGVFTILTAYLIFGRTIFPWDYLLWSESPFMTNMMKLDRGEPVFGPADEVNSFVYSPGLEYVCYALLSPFGLHLDVRFCRLISVILTALSGLMVAGAVIWSARTARETKDGVIWLFLTVCLALMLTFRNFTAGILHADNLYIFHAVLVLVLTAGALNFQRFEIALAAVIVAGFGILTKQTAVLSVVGALIALLAGHRWGAGKSIALLGGGALAAGAAFAFLYVPEHSRFQVFELLANQRVYSRKLAQLLLRDINIDPYRFVLIIFAIPAFIWGLRVRNRAYRSFLIAWACIGVFEAAPAMAGYFKTNGARNNLGIVDLWFFMLVWVWFSFRTRGSRAMQAANPDPPMPPGLTFVTSLFFVVALTPIQLAPPTFFRELVLEFPPPQFRIIKAHYQYSEFYEKKVGEDLKKGLRVLIPHGTAVLIRNGVREVPLDRIASAIELVAAEKTELAGTIPRLQAKYYDRIYLPRNYFFSGSWYGPDIEAAIGENYQKIETILDPNYFDNRGYNVGLGMMVELDVMEPKSKPGPPPTPAQ